MDSGKKNHEMRQLEHAFKIFSSKYGGMKPNSTEKIPLATNSDLNKWCMDAGIVGPYLTSGDVDIAFAQVKMRGSKYMTLEDVPKLLDCLAGKYAVSQRCDSAMARQLLVDKLSNSSFKLHGTTNVTGADRTGRLTEHSHYTGTQGHKGTVQHFENYRQEARKQRLD